MTMRYLYLLALLLGICLMSSDGEAWIHGSNACGGGGNLVGSNCSDILQTPGANLLPS